MPVVEIRKIYTQIERVETEAGKPQDPPLVKVAVVAIIKNPYAGKYVEDLSEMTKASVGLGQRITKMAAEALGYPAESYGKGAIIGTNGEQEHGVAYLTTAFGNVLRESIGGGIAWISSMTKRGGPGTTIDVPLAHKDALYVRSHYDGVTITLHDAPLPDEIAVICCVASRGRPNHRLGGLAAKDMQGKDGLV